MAFNDLYRQYNATVNTSQFEGQQRSGYEVRETDLGVGDSDGLVYDVSKHGETCHPFWLNLRLNLKVLKFLLHLEF